RIQPGDALYGGPLAAAPAGMVYQLSVYKLSGDALEDYLELIRFQWDPENYLARDLDSNIIPLTTGSGMDLGVNVMEWDGLMLSVVPIEDTGPGVLGPLLLFSVPNAPGTRRDLFTPIDVLQFLGIPAPVEGAFTLVSQSNKKGHPDADWRDGSEGYGIWFAQPETSDRIEIDPIVEYDSYQKIVFPPTGSTDTDTATYRIWVNPVYPESSFSNFGNVFRYQEVDYLFVDSVPLHDETGLIPMTGPQVPLGEEPIVEDGETVGYLYHGPSGQVCSLRVDHPWLTRCNTDPFESLIFDGDSAIVIDGDTVGFVFYNEDSSEVCELRVDDPALSKCEDNDGNNIEEKFYERIFTDVGTTPRQGTTTEGDTIVAPTLPMFGPLGSFLFELEAWLVFDPASGLEPLSLGRLAVDTDPTSNFQGMIATDRSDQANPFTLTETADRNFHFPGEDFLQGLEAYGLESPLNVIDDTRPIKIWLTMEPAQKLYQPAFGGGCGCMVDVNLDWEPDKPFRQMIVMSAWLPTTETFASVIENDDTTLAPATRPLIYRDLNPGTDPQTSLNEGNRWPTMTIHLNNVGP
ncbi:MAG TPA: hypothetical protein VM118_08660, partial [Acidobacteriota bacterium]|nr:hypothetical protein [Acidobacteriota bacterium]